MQIDKETLDKFKLLCEREFGEKFSDEEVFEMLNRMVNVLRALYFADSKMESDRKL